MKLKSILLTPDLYNDYLSFLYSFENTLIYSSIKYKNLLEKHLKCKAYYLLIIKGNKVIGSLPVMIMKSNLGKVANSLPYYGSNGGLIVDNNLSNEEKNIVRKKLIQSFQKLVKYENCITSTIISNPLDVDINIWLYENYKCEFVETRIGLITCLPYFTDNCEDELLKMYHNSRPRNIRKAIKSNITCYFSNKFEDLEFLFEIHHQNFKVINALPKKKSFFLTIPDFFNKDDFRVYVAEKDGVKIAALLLLYFNKTVEYFTPVVVESYRVYQPTALLIHRAMQDACKQNFKYWNWGGTSISQDGVYNFKKKWGTNNLEYKYYIKIYQDKILNYSKEILLKEFPYFYVTPFEKLISNE